METFRGRGVVKGIGRGPAMMSTHAVNFTAAFTKTLNVLPFKRAEFQDRHHPWFGKNVKGKVLIFPQCIGSTHTGLVLLDLVRLQNGPAAIIVDQADSLLVSGVVLSEVWYQRAIPIVEYPTSELMEQIGEGDTVEVDGGLGEIRVHVKTRARV